MAETLVVAEGIHRAVDLAREEARGYSSTQVDTEHLLLGLLRERKKKRNFVAWCLAKVDVTLDDVRRQVENLWSPHREAADELEFAFTPRLRNVVEQARLEARRLGDDYLGTEHLLLGLLEESEGGAARVLSNLGVNRGQARRAGHAHARRQPVRGRRLLYGAIVGTRRRLLSGRSRYDGIYSRADAFRRIALDPALVVVEVYL